MKVTIERGTLERALAYFEAPPAKLWPAGTLHGISASLRAALAQQPAEPVAWLAPLGQQAVPAMYLDAPPAGWRPLYFAAPAAVPPAAHLGIAPKCLNTNDKAMWVTGWNECRDTMIAAAGDKP